MKLSKRRKTHRMWRRKFARKTLEFWRDTCRVHSDSKRTWSRNECKSTRRSLSSTFSTLPDSYLGSIFSRKASISLMFSLSSGSWISEFEFRTNSYLLRLLASSAPTHTSGTVSEWSETLWRDFRGNVVDTSRERLFVTLRLFLQNIFQIPNSTI